MAAATTLPEDFMLEYDLLQLVDDHAFSGGVGDHAAAAAHANSSSSSSLTADVDELLANSFDGVGSFVDSSDVRATVGTTTADQLVKHADCLLSITADVDVAAHSNTAADDAFADFLINGDDFLREMEKVVKLDMGTGAAGVDPATSSCSTATSSSSSMSSPRCGGCGDTDDLGALTDGDVMSSPCPSSCPSGCADSPKRDDMDDLDALLLKDDAMWDTQPQPQPPQHQSQQQQQQSHAAFQQQLQHMQQMQLLQQMQAQQQLLMFMQPSAPVFHGVDSAQAMQMQMQQQTQQTQQTQQQAIDLTADDDDAATEADEDEDIEDAEAFDSQQAELAAKNDAELLQKEAKYLEAQYDYLLSRAKSSRPQRANVKAKRGRGTRTATAADKDALAKSTKDTTLLNELVTQQQVYLDNFKAMLAFAPVSDVRLALMTPMESYIHLGRDFDDRRRTILSLREEKLDMTFKYIEQKAAGLNLEQPYQYSDMFEKFGKNYCVNFAISRYDDVSVLAVAGAIYEQIAGKDEDLTSKMGCLTVRESYDHIRCNFMHQRIVSSMKWDESEAQAMPDIESNAIFYNRFDENIAIMATDYIDQDDLHPYQGSDRIRKDVSSGVVLTGHVDANGKNYVVMKRFLMAKFHMFPHKIPQEQQDKFFAKMPLCHDKMKTLVVDKLARKDAGGVDAHSCTGLEHHGSA